MFVSNNLAHIVNAHTPGAVYIPVHSVGAEESQYDLGLGGRAVAVLLIYQSIDHVCNVENSTERRNSVTDGSRRSAQAPY